MDTLLRTRPPTRIPTRSLVLALLAWALAACAPLRTTPEFDASPEQVAKRETAVALQQYESRLRSQDGVAVSALFVPAGRMEQGGQPPVVGRADIQRVVASFGGYKLLGYDMKLLSASPASTHVSQSGSYVQQLRAPDGKEITVRGLFVVQWQRQADGRWLIEHLHTSAPAVPERRDVPPKPATGSIPP